MNHDESSLARKIHLKRLVRVKARQSQHCLGELLESREGVETVRLKAEENVK
jgi:hypothetical protein